MLIETGSRDGLGRLTRETSISPKTNDTCAATTIAAQRRGQRSGPKLALASFSRFVP